MARPSKPTRTLRWWAPQIAVAAVPLVLLLWLAGNVSDNLARRGITTGFAFLDRAARFPISESVINYSPIDSFAWAFVVGLGNTLALSAIVIVASTALGLPIALARRSDHPMARHLAGGFVDLIRNTPLVVQLLFWYGIVTIGLPSSRSALQPLPGVFLTDRGLYLTSFGVAGSALPLIFVLVGGTLLTAVLTWRGRLKRARHAMLGTALAAATLWLALGLTLRTDAPVLGRFNFAGGMTLTPEFVAVVLGLVLYSSAFAAEIVRGGLDAIPRGQWDAGRAVGLSERQTLREIIMPQALRIIIPPMTSQYVNVIKNSTLALVVGYPELSFIAATTINQTGQAIEGIAVLMVVFLALSAGTSFAMNRLNARMAIVER